MSGINIIIRGRGRQVAQSVKRRTLEVVVRGWKPALGTWWWGRISPNQPHSKGAAPAATTPLIVVAEKFPNGINIVVKKRNRMNNDRLNFAKSKRYNHIDIHVI